jgi:hypothetical protein
MKIERKSKIKNRESLDFQKKLNSQGLYAERKTVNNKNYIYIRDSSNKNKVISKSKGSKLSDYEKNKGEVIATPRTFQRVNSQTFDKKKGVSKQANSFNYNNKNQKVLVVKLNNPYAYHGTPEKPAMRKDYYISSNVFSTPKARKIAELDLKQKLKKYQREDSDIETIELHEFKKRF